MCRAPLIVPQPEFPRQRVSSDLDINSVDVEPFRIGHFQPRFFRSDPFSGLLDLNNKFSDKMTEPRASGFSSQSASTGGFSPFDEIRLRLKRLRSHANRSIASLDGQMKSDYDAILIYTRTLRNTPEYGNYYSEISQIFGDIPKEQIKPATVASLFVGCLLQNKPEGNCDPICTGSFPRPDASESGFSTGSGVCEYKVISATDTAGGYQFEVLNDVCNSKGIVYLNGFHGFTEDEKNSLRRFGLSEVRVVDRNPADPGVDLQPIETLPSRVRSVLPPSDVAKNNDDNSIIWFIAVIALAIILIAAAIVARNKSD